MAKLPKTPLNISVAVTISLVFIFGLFFLGETPWLSIIYGLIGGMSAYYLVTWWQNDEKPEAAKDPDLIPFSKDINQMLLKSKLLRPEDSKKRYPTRATSILEWMLKSDKSPPK